MGLFLAFILPAIIASVASIGTAVASNVASAKSVENTNESNLNAVRETNASNVEQANLAYKRSLPAQQISDMRAAGISLPAAMQKLTGGGSYSMPTLQAGTSQAKQYDFSGIAESFDRLSSIPSNVMQAKLQGAQLSSLKQQVELANKEEMRKQEQHEFDMWQKLYGKDATMKIDTLASSIVQMAADKGISLDDITSTDALRKSFNLDDNEVWRTMPSMARSQVIDAVRTQAAEMRAQQTATDTHQKSIDEHRAANDAHIAALDSLKNSEFMRVKSAKEVAKITAETERIWQEVDDFNESKDARNAEYILRENRAKLEDLLTTFDISKEELRQSLYLDKNGNLNLKAGVKSGIQEAWKMAGSIFGVDYLGDILKGLLSFKV